MNNEELRIQINELTETVNNLNKLRIDLVLEQIKTMVFLQFSEQWEQRKFTFYAELRERL